MRTLLAAIFLSVAWLGGVSAEPREAGSIRAVMKGIWERPDALLAVDPVVVAENYAIADWEQGEMGGRALLKKSDRDWEVLLCAGDEIRAAAALHSAGVPPDLANRLAAELARSEEALPRSRREKFSSFKGLARMGQDLPSHQ